MARGTFLRIGPAAAKLTLFVALLVIVTATGTAQAGKARTATLTVHFVQSQVPASNAQVFFCRVANIRRPPRCPSAGRTNGRGVWRKAGLPAGIYAMFSLYNGAGGKQVCAYRGFHLLAGQRPSVNVDFNNDQFSCEP